MPRLVQKYRGPAEVEKGRPAGHEHVSHEFNYRFILPPKDWEIDNSLRVPLKANLFTMRRTNPNAWLALAALDYKTRTPRDAEVVDAGVRRLQGYFQDFEWAQEKDAEVGGQRAQRLVFQGEVHEVLMSGECFMVAHNGIAYWFTLWTPAQFVDRAANEFSDLRQRFALLHDRDGWTEKRPPVHIFRGHKVFYELRHSEGIWEEWPQPQDADANADLFLQAKDRVASQDVDKMAQVLVLLLQAQSDLPAAVAEARAYLKQQEEKNRTGGTIEDFPEKQGSATEPGHIGTARGRIIKLRIKGDNRNRFVLLAVVPGPQHVLVIECTCDLRRRSLWQRDFDQLLSTFRVQEP